MLCQHKSKSSFSPFSRFSRFPSHNSYDSHQFTSDSHESHESHYTILRIRTNPHFLLPAIIDKGKTCPTYAQGQSAGNVTRTATPPCTAKTVTRRKKACTGTTVCHCARAGTRRGTGTQQRKPQRARDIARLVCQLSIHQGVANTVAVGPTQTRCRGKG